MIQTQGTECRGHHGQYDHYTSPLAWHHPEWWRQSVVDFLTWLPVPCARHSQSIANPMAMLYTVHSSRQGSARC